MLKGISKTCFCERQNTKMGTDNQVKVLLIDDSKGVRQFLTPALGNMGMKVLGEASNGPEGIELYKQLMPDIVFLDLVMPLMPGIEVLKKIKEINPDAVVIILTSAADRDSVLQSKTAGAAGYLLKPFDIQKIKKTIKAIMAESIQTEGLQ
jgi:two-component system chemotaxis response regulator CheY